MQSCSVHTNNTVIKGQSIERSLYQEKYDSLQKWKDELNSVIVSMAANAYMHPTIGDLRPFPLTIPLILST